jgi:DNA-binding CsgD family transcriptional regulator
MSVVPSQLPFGSPESPKLEADSLVFAAASIVKEMAGSIATRPVREVVSQSWSFRLEGHRLQTATETTGPILLVFVEALPEQLPEDAELHSRFGLTRKEARVARLIAEDLTNDEVAAQLSISPHTARHHTERVLAKLGVRSRLRVRAALLR